MRTQIANIITSCRFLCSIWMLCFPVFSTSFYVLYLFCGFTDIVDGTIARKANAVSEFGAKLDTVADIAFVSASLFKFFPAIHVQEWLWKWIAVIAFIKISNHIWGFICQKKIIALHTVANKITGLFLFLLPLTLPFIDLNYSVPAVCTIATFSAIQEGYYIGTGCEMI